MLSLSISSNYSQNTNDKITRAHRIINQVKSYESNGYITTAEDEIKKLIPVV